MAKPERQITYRQLLPNRFSMPAGIEPSTPLNLCHYYPIVCRGGGCSLLRTAISQAPGGPSYDPQAWEGFKNATVQAAQKHACPLEGEMGEILNQLD